MHVLAPGVGDIHHNLTAQIAMVNSQCGGIDEGFGVRFVSPIGERNHHGRRGHRTCSQSVIAAGHTKRRLVIVGTAPADEDPFIAHAGEETIRRRAAGLPLAALGAVARWMRPIRTSRSSRASLVKVSSVRGLQGSAELVHLHLPLRGRAAPAFALRYAERAGLRWRAHRAWGRVRRALEGVWRVPILEPHLGSALFDQVQLGLQELTLSPVNIGAGAANQILLDLVSQARPFLFARRSSRARPSRLGSLRSQRWPPMPAPRSPKPNDRRLGRPAGGHRRQLIGVPHADPRAAASQSNHPVLFIERDQIRGATGEFEDEPASGEYESQYTVRSIEGEFAQPTALGCRAEPLYNRACRV